jgi:hypothetical protein
MVTLAKRYFAKAVRYGRMTMRGIESFACLCACLYFKSSLDLCVTKMATLVRPHKCTYRSITATPMPVSSALGTCLYMIAFVIRDWSCQTSLSSLAGDTIVHTKVKILAFAYGH